MSSLRDRVTASLPASIPLPEALGEAFDWMEANGCVDARGVGGLYPLDDPGSDASQVGFHPSCADDVRAWTGSADPAVTDRLAEIARTGGDGSSAGLWRDDEGRICVVHLGSGSGSTLASVLATDPVEFLRFLAIGYPEPCWAEVFSKTFEEVAADEVDEDEELPPPAAFRAWVCARFGVTVPRTGAEIVRRTAFLDDEDSPDPFTSWLEGLRSGRGG